MDRVLARACIGAVVVGVALFGVGAGPALGIGSAPAGVWTRPVAGPVVRPFEAPRTRYGPGHRGVDFAAAPGTPVVAAGPGVVVFAGRIGPSSHVVVLHEPSGWRTGYSFLASVAVRLGEPVGGGTVVGTSGGVGDNHDGTVLHFSLRIGDQYVDPMILFQPIDLAAAVHLAPTASDGSGMGFVDERRALVDGLRADAAVPLSQAFVAPARWRPLARWRYF
ncbi:MAG TPA: peptidoglycan DD-metalloendopeptidase family protein [Acidimicrobiia bacterium]|jgi:murein DD-endopeptidase MepM/ murein hydrolase activator NlpD